VPSGFRFCLKAASPSVSVPALRDKVLNGLAAWIVFVVGVVIAFLAHWHLLGVKKVGWDGQCWAATPVWSVGQALLGGVALFLGWHAFDAARTRQPVSVRSPVVARLGVFLLAVVVWYVAVAALRPESRELPPTACYGDDY
jgi:hypothetical protein